MLTDGKLPLLVTQQQYRTGTAAFKCRHVTTFHVTQFNHQTLCICHCAFYLMYYAMHALPCHPLTAKVIHSSHLDYIKPYSYGADGENLSQYLSSHIILTNIFNYIGVFTTQITHTNNNKQILLTTQSLVIY